MIDLTRYFTILGLEPDVTLEEVEQHYKDLVSSMHPDTQTSEEKRRRFEEKVKKFNHARDMIKKHYVEWQAFRKSQAAGTTSGTAGRQQGKDDSARRAEEARKRAEEERDRKKKEAEAQGEDSLREQEEFNRLHEAYVAAQAAAEKQTKQNREIIANTAAISVVVIVVAAAIALASNLIAQGRIFLLKHDADAWTVRERDRRLAARYDRYREEAKIELANLLGREPTAGELDNYRPPFKASAGSAITPPWEQPPPLNPDSSDKLTQPYWQEKEKQTEEDRRQQKEQQAQQQERYRQNRIATLQSDISTLKQQLDRLQQQLSGIDRDIAVETAKMQDNQARMSAVEQAAGADYMNNAADRRWHPREFAQWQAFQQLAETARSRISVMQAQQSSLQADSRNLQSKLEKADTELQQLKPPSSLETPAPTTSTGHTGVPMEQISPDSSYGQRLKQILDKK